MKARQQALQMWQSAEVAKAAHPYLTRKQQGAYGIRQQTTGY
ncbi:MAG: hypothetical protein R3E95_06745 [Thiolinea sp.]